jgi:hypothetical protein
MTTAVRRDLGPERIGLPQTITAMKWFRVATTPSWFSIERRRFHDSWAGRDVIADKRPGDQHAEQDGREDDRCRPFSVADTASSPRECEMFHQRVDLALGRGGGRQRADGGAGRPRPRRRDAAPLPRKGRRSPREKERGADFTAKTRSKSWTGPSSIAGRRWRRRRGCPGDRPVAARAAPSAWAPPPRSRDPGARPRGWLDCSRCRRRPRNIPGRRRRHVGRDG